MEISYCKIEIENVDYVKRVIESLPSDVKLSEYKNLVTIEVLRKNGKKDIYDLYFNPIFENSMAR
ncbi:MAG TPA: hypothetical protein EYH49_06575 [Aquifex aeolicus]|nr:hypothetical protein [Aquifex aeolicus]